MYNGKLNITQHYKEWVIYTWQNEEISKSLYTVKKPERKDDMLYDSIKYYPDHWLSGDGLGGNMAWKKAQSIIWKWRKYFVSWCGGLLLVTNLTEFFTLNTKCLFQTNYSLIKCLKNKMQVFFRSKNLYFWAMIQKHLFFFGKDFIFIWRKGSCTRK